MYILAIESSCDETAASVIENPPAGGENGIRILSNVIASQIDIHKEFGGVFPEKASRAHAEKIIPVVEEALNGIDPDLVAVTVGPGLIGSLLVGVNFAKTYAFARNKPIIGINHWLGHIYSNWAEEPHPQFPALFLIVSGGHTGLVLMEDYDKIKPLGETLDDAAGEAFDKISNLLGLGYPGGPAISKAAEEGDPKAFNFPRAMTDRKDYNFSFSGLKTAVLNETKKMGELSEKNKKDIAASFQQTVVDILINKTIRAAYEYQPKSICLCGGVSANKELREQMQKAVMSLRASAKQSLNPSIDRHGLWPHDDEKVSFHVPPIVLSTDNAAMVGLAAAYMDKSKYTTFENINADSNLKL
ncbi:TPA: tRNA (adenosine(37)-N6)-threonylcarbamoyltransferase complex transferase subunit TsaD [Candidatus Berkelbacteria bacterium]|uniref:tRNA N6-adenosine threonylcarbamoyltransferase n=1 Tax=Berkelbacteria bacterium GW2011_GWE1_39_12 TaxID=1618337 RepID=A0A0G4B5M1_9BACT|nr:MAG: glycoprotease family metalloendopeptidase, O-sialoglycoprotein endopeptidase [Berkelbacteria bacterium GW2011_GWE1_39_12]HBO60888.1 tRNA (adenosine(37)-N6)-threonylcarbamoyltransferase complex transferase subunit TsaD [Candidatus Berkelbacteria bacterium]